MIDYLFEELSLDHGRWTTEDISINFDDSLLIGRRFFRPSLVRVKNQSKKNSRFVFSIPRFSEDHDLRKFELKKVRATQRLRFRSQKFS